MEFIDDKVKELLEKLPSEGPEIDYKVILYQKYFNQTFLRDVIAMLNCEAAMGKDKFIIFGVSDSRERKGIDKEKWRDDNEFQNLVKFINPRPDVRTGLVEFDEKYFGYIFISASNDEWIYESTKTYTDEGCSKESNIVIRCQAFTRVGSRNDIMTEKNRRHLLEQKNLYLSSQKNNMDTIDSNYLWVVALFGRWSEKNSADMEEIEIVSGVKASIFIEDIRKLYYKMPSIFSFSDGIWRVKDHQGLLIAQAEHIFDDHIEKIFESIRRCFSDVDRKYELSSEKRCSASLYLNGQNRKYSEDMNRGLAETLAILGNNRERFVHCSKNIIYNKIYDFMCDYYKNEDWRVFATGARNLDCLGEACPKVFLDEIIRILSESDNAFLQFLHEKEEFIISIQYGYELESVLSNIAKEEDYFSKAMYALFQLTKHRESSLDSLVNIVLPYYPQTHAPLQVRVGIFRGLMEEDEELTWKILMKLMPGAVTISRIIPHPQFLSVEPISERVSREEEIEALLGYLSLALEWMESNVERMCEMVSFLDDVPKEIRQKIIDQIEKYAENLSVPNKEKLWTCLMDFLTRHRRFSDAAWALSEKELTPVVALKERMLPNSEHISSVRLFRTEQFSLFENKNNSEEERKTLHARQTDALRRIYERSGMDGLLSFSEEVENKMLVGSCSASFLTFNDIGIIISQSKDLEHDELLRGVILETDFKKLVSILSDRKDIVKALVVSKIPLSDEVIEYIEKLNSLAEDQFWKKTQAWWFTINNLENIEKAIIKCNKVLRTDSSILILYDCIEKKEEISSQLIIETLNLHANSQNYSNLDFYHIQELIRWLQNQNIDREIMISIEWKYLILLEEENHCSPLYIWNELSTNPEFYINIIKLMCGKEESFEGAEVDKAKVVNQCRKLLEGWRRIPGVDMNGKFDGNILQHWMSVVDHQIKDDDIKSIAEYFFGKVAFYAPSDKDGFFIEKDIARYLQKDKEGHALSGYRSESINSRGAHWIDPTGEDEFLMEREYRKKARSAEENGMFRFASTLREIADFYYEEGKRNIERHRLEQNIE